MFGAATVSLLVLLLVVSVLGHQAPLFLLALVLLLATGLSQLWGRYCFTGLEYRRRFRRRRVAFGEVIELELEIVNRKLLPLAWLEIEDEIPKALPPRHGKVYATHKAGRAILGNLFALRPYERVRRYYQFPAGVRGEHVFGPVRLRTGDLFGLVTRELDLALLDDVVVLPRVVPIASPGLPARQPLGDRRIRSWLFEDPSRIAGARDYRPEDSLRRIHWAASARTQRLQSRVYEATTSHQLLLLLNLTSTPAGWWGLHYDPDALELGICTAASLATWAVAAGYPVGLVTNGMHRLRSLRVGVELSGDPSQLPRLLETLGRLQLFAVRPFDRTLAEEGRRLPFGATAVVISAVVDAPLVGALLALRARGQTVVLVYVGRDETLPRLPGVTVRRVGPPEQWQTLPALSLVAASGTAAPAPATIPSPASAGAPDGRGAP